MIKETVGYLNPMQRILSNDLTILPTFENSPGYLHFALTQPCPGTAMKSWTLSGVKLHAVWDSAKSSCMLSGTALSQAACCQGQHSVKLHAVQDSTESNCTCCHRQRWAKLHAVRDSVESRCMLFGTAVSHAKCCLGQSWVYLHAFPDQRWVKLCHVPDSAEPNQTNQCSMFIHSVKMEIITTISVLVVASPPSFSCEPSLLELRALPPREHT